MSEERSSPAVFSLEGLSFSYDGATWILRDLDLALKPGQQLGLHGPNGIGKTTLFRCITGLVRPQRGTIRFHGDILAKEADFHLLRCNVAFMLQNADDQLFFPTVLEDVAFGPLNLGLTPTAARELAMEMLEKVGLAGFASRLTHRLSGGEKKLVALAGMLAMRPEALLLDEPSAGLDAPARQRLIEILQDLGTSRITISHDRDFLAQVSHEYATIRDGQLTAIPRQTLIA